MALPVAADQRSKNHPPASRGRGGRLSITLGPGRPEATPEAILSLRKFRTGLNGCWICTRVTHRLASNGYTTSATAEAAIK